MNEVVQRFRERFQMWRQEQKEGLHGAPAGEGEAENRIARNPLSWALLVALIWLLPPYDSRSFFDLMRPVSGFVFLAFYFAKSRFAWHVLAAELLIISPCYVFFSFSWRLQRVLRPGIEWVPIVATLLMLVFVVRSRRPYLDYLEQQRQSEVT
jgi:hypothetical protein